MTETGRSLITITHVDLGPGVGAVFTGRAGGVSEPPYAELNMGAGVGDDITAVRENRDRVAMELGLDPARTVWMRQVHGADVTHVTSAVLRGSLREDGAALVGDGIVTTEPALVLGVLAADCAPVLLADPVAGVVGAVHAGRLGTAAGVVPAAVAQMRAHGAEPSRITAVIGPMVCGACYEVPGELRAQVAEAVPAVSSTTRWGTPGLDLGAGIIAQLRQAGVESIRSDPRCTLETPDLFSFRRDGRTGRFAGLIWLSGE